MLLENLIDAIADRFRRLVSAVDVVLVLEELQGLDARGGGDGIAIKGPLVGDARRRDAVVGLDELQQIENVRTSNDSRAWISARNNLREAREVGHDLVVSLCSAG